MAALDASGAGSGGFAWSFAFAWWTETGRGEETKDLGIVVRLRMYVVLMFVKERADLNY